MLHTCRSPGPWAHEMIGPENATSYKYQTGALYDEPAGRDLCRWLLHMTEDSKKRSVSHPICDPGSIRGSLSDFNFTKMQIGLYLAME